MNVTEHLHVLPIREQAGPIENLMHLSLILDDTHGPVLIDTGMPGREEVIRALLAEVKVAPRDLHAILLTHQDLDHVGSAAALARQGAARVLAHPLDAPVIDGRVRALKLPPPAVLATLPPEVRATLERGAEPVPVNGLLHDGERLDLAGGVRVVHTPGHTPGHVSLYLERDRVLIAGDALMVHDGRVLPPPAATTPDLPRAWQSIARLAELDVAVLVAYHGGVLRDEVNAQLRALAAQVPA
ncbi:MBL fold metallo-hydrolase [Deinococcus pimensis]|uniref:MBL fold metallo-hydrolase n=1 Tax=Deinococcus pimensis TaxID=309888 RepID=UPI00047F3DB6|nr:MBL fold metallo-hydrolase [Deinococcus pimensis]